MNDSKLIHVNALSHVNTDGMPQMVDVSNKSSSERAALAEARVVFPSEVANQLQSDLLRTAKGSVIDTAIIAGTMAAKETSRLIPFCHPLAIDQCKISVTWCDEQTLLIQARVRCTGKTGVEMEALTAASVAALTIYDMTKALSHEIAIEGIRLLEKTGGKSDLKVQSGPTNQSKALVEP